MPRASSILPTVNSSGHQEVNISNTSVAVNDATAQTSLSSISAAMVACDTGNVNVATSSLPTGASTSSNQSTANSSLSSIDSKLTAPLQVSSSATVNGSRGNLINLSSVVAGDFTTSVDISSYSKSSITIKSDSSDSVELWISQDQGISYDLHGALYPQQPYSGGSDYYSYLKLDGDVLTDVKLKFTGSATSVTGSCFSRA
jgi:hypothetical protein|tara:strand:- start:6068 stop:6670 length:603 start_codon:yes stop_codon:yes gene_type:complete